MANDITVNGNGGNGHGAILAPPPMSLGETMTLAETFARSGFFTDAREAAQAVVKIMAGRELGFGPMASMTGVYVVKNRVCLSANLMAAAIQRSGRFNYHVADLDETACTIEFTDGGQRCGTSRFTLDDAKAAGLLGNQTWKQYPRNMLFARAMSNGCRWYCAGVFGGPVYTPEEMGAMVDGETGDVIDAPPRALPEAKPKPAGKAPPKAAQPDPSKPLANDDPQVVALVKRIDSVLTLDQLERARVYVEGRDPAIRYHNLIVAALVGAGQRIAASPETLDDALGGGDVVEGELAEAGQ